MSNSPQSQTSPSPGRGASRDILDHFSGEPRDEQREILRQVQRAYATSDVLVLRMPVGAGKSRVAECLVKWAGGGTIAVPNNALLQQYLDTWPTMPAIPRGTPRGSPRARAVAQAPVKVANFYTYLAHRLYSPCVVFDEAHKLVGMLQEMEAVTLWQHLKPVPGWVQNAGDLLVWAEAHGEDKLARKLRQHPDSYTLEAGVGEYRGHSRSYIRLVPLTPRHNRPILWPQRTVRKLVFMSATFSAEDLHDLGLEGRRVTVLDCGSPIAAADRPVVYWPTANMSMASQAAGLPALEARLRQVLAKHPDERGVIHTTYALAEKLRARLGDEPRLRWHTPATAHAVYREWRRDPGPSVLVACGMTEGIDLPGDLCRWQVVTKLMFPDLTDPAVSAKRQARPEWYTWMPVRDLQQAVGRSSRGPGDRSVVYVVDNSFGMLYSRHQDMFTPAFQEALHTAGVDFV